MAQLEPEKETSDVVEFSLTTSVETAEKIQKLAAELGYSDNYILENLTERLRKKADILQVLHEAEISFDQKDIADMHEMIRVSRNYTPGKYSPGPVSENPVPPALTSEIGQAEEIDIIFSTDAVIKKNITQLTDQLNIQIDDLAIIIKNWLSGELKLKKAIYDR